MSKPSTAVVFLILQAAFYLAAVHGFCMRAQEIVTLSEEERARLTAELATLRQRAQMETEAELRTVKNRLEEALSSDVQLVQLYTDAVRTTEFRGLKNGTSLFLEWRKKNETSLQSPETRAAIRQHIEYLLLTLKALSGVKRDVLMENLFGYAARLDQEQRIDRSHPLLARSFVVTSPIARLFAIGAPKGEWIAEAGNTSAMFDRLILPWMREKKDPRLLDYWKYRIQTEQSRATADRVEFRADTFEKIDLPRLRWSQAKDTALLGNEAAAFRQMIDILRSLPTHPDFESWSEELEKKLAPRTLDDKKESIP